MTRKEYELTIGTVMFPAITKNDLEEVMGGRSLSEFIKDPQIHISETQREAVGSLLEFFDGMSQGNVVIQMVDVESSNVKSIGYDPISSTMYVNFRNSGRYAYHDVPEEEYNEVLTAESVGRALGHIKANYITTKVQ